jgi:hypothetical protein
VGAAALSSEGFVHVRVDEKQAKGTHLNLVVPAGIVPIAIPFIPRHDLAQGSSDMREFLPIIDAAIPALRDCPDGVLVEVRDGGDHVVVAKSGGSLVIDVTDPDDDVHVSVPLRAAQHAIHEIAAAKGPV